MINSWRVRFHVSVLVLVLAAFSGRATAAVDLRLQGPVAPVVAGMDFDVNLFAVANPGPSETIGEAEILISWDNAIVAFNGEFVEGTYNWPQSGFSLSNPDGINDDLTDGLVAFRVIASPDTLASADTVGLLVATFKFTALVATSPATTTIDLPISAGATPTPTMVLATIGGADVTGVLTGDTVEIISCATLFDCDDSDACTTQSCTSGVCVFTPTFTVGVECCNPLNGAISVIDDGNECTSDLCDAATGIVTNDPVPFGSLCGEPDNLPCSLQDTCDAVGVCQPNNNPDGWFCDADGDTCSNDWCQSGVCVLKNAEPDGTACDDGLNFCTPGQDTCLAGVCQNPTDPCAGTPATPFCVEDGSQAVCVECRVGFPTDCPTNGCLRGSCCPGSPPFCIGPAWTAACVTFADNALCADGEFCNGLETCNAVDGTCIPDPDPNRCINPDFPYCQESTDTCEACLVDAHCDNGIACDGAEICNTSGASNVCESGPPVDCSVLDTLCTLGQCQEPDGSCVAVPINEGLLGCSDGDGCTQLDACVGGTCVGGPSTGLGGVSLEMRLPAGAPTTYSIGDNVDVDLFAVLDNSITTCSLSGIACQFSSDCPIGETCITATSQQFLLLEAVFDWDAAVFDFVEPATFEPCDECAGCSVTCTSDADCLVDTPGVPDCLCDATGAAPPCPDPPQNTVAHCRQKFVGYPDSCPGTPASPPCSASCPAGQFDWQAVAFPGNNSLNVSFTDGDAFVTVTEPLGSGPAVVTSTQDLWVARFTFNVVGGSGGSTTIGFTECAGDPANNPTLTRVVGSFDAITGTLTGVSVTAAGCSDQACDDGLACNGAETCASPTPGDCQAGVPLCDDNNACTSNVCAEPGDCSYPPNYNVATECCNPSTGGTVAIDDSNQCTDDICDPLTGVVSHPPLPASTPCSDADPCTDNDVCDGAGTCAGTQIPGCQGCTSDVQCDDLVACTVDKCVDQFGLPCGAGPCTCANTPDDSLCADNGVHCDGDEICHPMAGCVSSGPPCPGCDEQAVPPCPCEAPGLESGGPRYLVIRPEPIESTDPVKLLVTSPDFPCLAKFVGSLRCGGVVGGDACKVDAECNACSFTQTPCLVDDDCDFGLCTNGQECSVSQQNCVDQSLCIRNENCVLSGDLCVPAPLATIDINNDGAIDGTVAALVDNPADAAVLTPAEWTAGVMRCSKSAAPCTVDSDCPRGTCTEFNAFCDVFAQDCTTGAGVCVRDEVCLSGAVYVSGEDIQPSDFDQPTQMLLPVRYEVSAQCSITIPPVSTTMWRWADTSNDSFVSIVDIQLIILAIQGQYNFSTIVNDDLAGLDLCTPQQFLNVSDTQRSIRAQQGEMYRDTECPSPCP